MVDSDLKSYTVLYLENAQKELNLLRSLISQEVPDLKELHRVSHTLKGQSFFMGFNDIGLKALELETYFKGKLENTQTNDLNVEAILEEIEVMLKNK
jgi:chemotaxis protein histidine kinase CheA